MPVKHHTPPLNALRNGDHPALRCLQRAEEALQSEEARQALRAARRAVEMVENEVSHDVESMQSSAPGDAAWDALDGDDMLVAERIGADREAWHTGRVSRDAGSVHAFGQPVQTSDLTTTDAYGMTCAQVFTRSALRNPLQPSVLGGGGEGRGSSFVVDVSHLEKLQVDHVLITNYHVVANSVGDVHVSFPGLGAREIPVTKIAACPSRDLAVLGLRSALPKDVVPLAVGDSDALRQGDKCYAVGYPLGKPLCALTDGLISGVELLRNTGLIRMSAAINPGNSGGGLLVDGKVVGVNSRKLTNADGMGYAIPINEVMAMLRSVSYDPSTGDHATQLIERAVLGASFQSSDATQALSLGNPETGGYYVNHVLEGTMLHNDGEGLRRGDQITSVSVTPRDGEATLSMSVDATGSTTVPWATNPVPFARVLDRLEHGDTLHLRVLRDQGQSVALAVPYHTTTPFAVREVLPEFESFVHDTVGGMVVCELTTNHLALALRSNVAGLAPYLSPEGRRQPALLVTHVYTASPASSKRVPILGHVLRAVNGVAVDTIASLHALFQAQSTAPYWTFETEQHSDLVLSKASLLEANDLTIKSNGLYGPPSVAVSYLDASTTATALASLTTAPGAAPGNPGAPRSTERAALLASASSTGVDNGEWLQEREALLTKLASHQERADGWASERAALQETVASLRDAVDVVDRPPAPLESEMAMDPRDFFDAPPPTRERSSEEASLLDPLGLESNEFGL